MIKSRPTDHTTRRSSGLPKVVVHFIKIAAVIAGIVVLPLMFIILALVKTVGRKIDRSVKTFHPATLSAEGSGNLVSVASGCIGKAPPTSDFTVAYSKHVSPLGFEWYLGVTSDSLDPAENRDIVASIDKFPRFER
jgi:hypothetical protein